MSEELRNQLEIAVGGAYRITRELGGGMAHVYVADEIATGKSVVLKVLAAELGIGVSLERFRREIQVAASLDHPNVVPVRTVGQHGKLIWYTMPFIEGESLRGLLERERQLPVERTLEIVRDVSAALSYAHARNIVHRDIKPDNILIDGAGRAIVTDFGIARAIEKSADLVSITSTGLTLGTPAYMSPEQAAGNSNVDGRSDVYSLACVIYEMLAGEPPFTGPTAQAIIARHLHEAPRSLRVIRPAIGEPLQRVIEKALAKTAADRFATADEFVAMLQSPPQGSIEAVSARVGRRNRLGFVTAGFAVLALLGYAAVATFRRDEVRPPDPTRVAVLYFEAPAADPELVSIARGVTRDVIASLPKGDLTVISSSGVEQFGANADPKEVSALLDGAGTLVYGSVEPLNTRDSMRVTVRLVDAHAVQFGDFSVEAARASPLAARDEVVKRVAEELRVRLGRTVALTGWKAETKSAEAWALRQAAQVANDRARQMVANGSRETAAAAYLTADSLLRMASREDPDWSEPALARGWAMFSRALMGGGGRPDARLIDSALAIADAAVTAGTRRAAALELRGYLRYRKWQFVLDREDGTVRDSAEADVRAATAQDPSLARAWHTLSSILQDRGDVAAATDAARRAIAADPYLRDATPTYSRLIFSYLNAERFDSARVLCLRALQRFPDDPVTRTCELTVLGWAGRGAADTRAARAALARDEAHPPNPQAVVGGIMPVSRFLYAAVLARSGLRDSAVRIVSATREVARASGHAADYLVNEAHVWTVLGRADTAVALLSSLVRATPPMRDRVAQHPWFKPLSSDARFGELIGRR